MHGLPEIAVIVTTSHEQSITDNVRALLAEIATMLAELLKTNKPDSIDLRSLPLLPGEYEAIKTILGEGEIKADLDALGPTHIYETGLAGVWWVRHNNENDECVAEVIEVTRIPDILKSPVNEIEISQSALKQQLKEWSENT